MALILVLEDDPVARAIESRALSILSEATIIGAASLAEVKMVLEEIVPDLVVVDLVLPDGSGLDVLSLLRKKNLHPPIIVVSSHLDEMVPPTHPSSIVTFPKPVNARAFAEAARKALGEPSQNHPFSLAEYVQLAGLGGHTVLLHCETPQGLGSVTVVDGWLWAAHFAEKSGFSALALLLRSKQLTINVQSSPFETGPREMMGGWQELLLEAARLEDEAASRSKESFLDIPPESIRDLVQAGVRAVVAGDYPQAVRTFERALAVDPSNRAVRHRLERLYELGYRSQGLDSNF